MIKRSLRVPFFCLIADIYYNMCHFVVKLRGMDMNSLKKYFVYLLTFILLFSDMSVYAGQISFYDDTTVISESFSVDASADATSNYVNQYYTVIFNRNCTTQITGSPMLPQSIKTGMTVALKKNTMGRKGYAFYGWNTEKDGSGVMYGDEAKVRNLAPSGQNMILYAQWISTDISLSLNTVSLNLAEDDDPFLLTASYLPEQLSKEAPVWNNSNEAVVTLSENSSDEMSVYVCPVSAGESKITFSIYGFSISCNVTVRETEKKDEEEEKPSEYDYESEDLSDALTKRDIALYADGKVPDGLWVAGLEESYLYTGKKIKPAVRVYNRDERLTEKVDYKITYTRNTNARKKTAEFPPAIILHMKGDFSGTQYIPFTIEPVDMKFTEPYDLVLQHNRDLKYLRPLIVYNGKTLKRNVDFTVDSEHGRMASTSKAGEAVKIEGMGNFKNSISINVTIYPDIISIKKARIVVEETDYDEAEVLKYGGVVLNDNELRVFCNRKRLTKDVDYSVTYENNDSVGKGVAVIHGIGDYAGTVRKKFTINGNKKYKIFNVDNTRIHLDKVAYTEYFQVHYTGRRVRPAVTDLYIGDELLTEGKDYEISYENNLKTGTAFVVITGKGKCSGEKKLPFKIIPVNIEFTATAGFTSGTEQYIFKKGGVRPNVTVKLIDSGKVLVEGRDYRLKFKNNKRCGNAVVTVKAIGNYMGSLKLQFDILKRTENGTVLMTAVPETYSSKKGDWKAALAVYDLRSGKLLTHGVDYRNVKYTLTDGSIISENAALPNGTVIKIKADGIRAFEGLSFEDEYTIGEKNLLSAKVEFDGDGEGGSSAPEFIYSGDNIVPAVQNGEIKVYMNGEELKYGTDYTVIFDASLRRVNHGIYPISVIGTGAYCGMNTVYYTIAPRPVRRYWYGNAEK